VRVLIASPTVTVTVPADTDEHEPAIAPLRQIGLNAGLRTPAASGLFRVALQAGLLGVIANIIPLGLGMVLTGILAALLYHRAGGGALPTSKAARLGGMAGAISFAASSLFGVFGIVVLHAQNEFREVLMRAMDQRVTNPSDPQVQAALQWLHSPEGFAVALGISMVMALILSMLFSGIGCVIGGVLFRDRTRPML
jgi:hypothetical protein